MSAPKSTNAESNYLVAGSRPWNRRVFEERIAPLPGTWSFVAAPEELTPEFLSQLRPDVIFFLHWSWIVEAAILDRYECIGFHLGDLPLGRGGSPLQNLIERCHRETMLTALRLTEELDAGPVYAKRPISLEGAAEEIFLRSSALAAEMIAELVAGPRDPVPQSGEVTVFKRRQPAESRIARVPDLPRLHDVIRMLDADGYPHAFLEHEGFRYEFRRAVLYDGRIEADVRITPAASDD